MKLVTILGNNHKLYMYFNMHVLYMQYIIYNICVYVYIFQVSNEQAEKHPHCR